MGYIAESSGDESSQLLREHHLAIHNDLLPILDYARKMQGSDEFALILKRNLKPIVKWVEEHYGVVQGR